MKILAATLGLASLLSASASASELVPFSEVEARHLQLLGELISDDDHALNETLLRRHPDAVDSERAVRAMESENFSVRRERLILSTTTNSRWGNVRDVQLTISQMHSSTYYGTMIVDSVADEIYNSHILKDLFEDETRVPLGFSSSFEAWSGNRGFTILYMIVYAEVTE